MTATIFLDEAGYTGSHLSNAEQSVFVLASHQIPESNARALLREHFPKSQAQELKHSNVRKYSSGRRGMVALVRAIKAENMPMAIYPVHKQFSLFQRFFDYMVEPVLHAQGIDAYENAFNITATNLGYVGLESIVGSQLIGRFLGLFETAVRRGSQPHLQAAWWLLKRARNRHSGSARSMIDLLLVSRLAGDQALEGLPPNPLDPGLSTMVALMAHWRRLSAGPFEVVHDQSTSMAKNQPIWDWLSSPEQQEATLGFSDYRDLILPLNVERTRFERSHDHAGLQLADLLAGGQLELCRHILGDRREPGYAEALIEAGLDEVVNNIWPDADWRPPERAGAADAVDPLDFIARSPAARAALG